MAHPHPDPSRDATLGTCLQDLARAVQRQFLPGASRLSVVVVDAERPLNGWEFVVSVDGRGFIATTAPALDARPRIVSIVPLRSLEIEVLSALIDRPLPCRAVAVRVDRSESTMQKVLADMTRRRGLLARTPRGYAVTETGRVSLAAAV